MNNILNNNQNSNLNNTLNTLNNTTNNIASTNNDRIDNSIINQRNNIIYNTKSLEHEDRSQKISEVNSEVLTLIMKKYDLERYHRSDKNKNINND